MYTLLSYLPTHLLPEHPPFARYVKEKILDPLGLTSTTYSPQVAQESGHLADPIAREGIDKDKDIFGKGKTRVMRFPGWFLDEGEDGRFISGAGGVIMSAKDAATWLQVLLLNGEHPQTHKQVIPSEVLKKVTSGITVQTAEPRYPELSTTTYGGGQARGSYRGHNYIEHGGTITGYRTQITRFPDSKFGVAVFSNDDDWGSSFIEVIKWRIIDEVFGLEPIDWDSRTKKAAIEAHEKRQSKIKPRPENPAPPPVPFEQLSGVYRNLGYGDVEFCFVGGSNTQTCKDVLEDLPTILPGGVQKDIPTLIAKWDRFRSTHAKLEHFDGPVFNLTTLESRPTDEPSDPYWTATPSTGDEIHKAEFVLDEGKVVGFGITGEFWGAGSEVKDPVGGSVKEKAEVWFDKV
uniref:Beta-lactamase-related domain-containing protein n=1 Tax=Moniliophthora roreri TaxID=221103 RepID=A0A0W0G336_MONRR